ALGRHLAGQAGGDVLLAHVAAVACATILAVVAGLMMAASTALARDLFGHVLMLGRPRERQEIAVARVAAVLVAAIAISLAIFARNLNVAFLVGLAFAVAASANLPAITLGLFWRRFNGTGAVAGIYGGLSTAVLLVIFSPVVSGGIDPITGKNRSLLPPGVDFSWFPLENPALVSIPAGFLCAVAGTYLSRDEPDPARFAALSARAVTGVGAA
ncbi:solute symporter family protein, partial [Actinoallomurus acaciae]